MLRLPSMLVFLALSFVIFCAPIAAQPITSEKVPGPQTSPEATPKTNNQPAWLSNIGGAGASNEIVREHSPTLTKIEEMIAATEAEFSDRNWRSAEIETATERLLKAQATLRIFA